MPSRGEKKYPQMLCITGKQRQLQNQLSPYAQPSAYLVFRSDKISKEIVEDYLLTAGAFAKNTGFGHFGEFQPGYNPK